MTAFTRTGVASLMVMAAFIACTTSGNLDQDAAQLGRQVTVEVVVRGIKDDPVGPGLPIWLHTRQTMTWALTDEQGAVRIEVSVADDETELCIAMSNLQRRDIPRPRDLTPEERQVFDDLWSTHLRDAYFPYFSAARRWRVPLPLHPGQHSYRVVLRAEEGVKVFLQTSNVYTQEKNVALPMLRSQGNANRYLSGKGLVISGLAKGKADELFLLTDTLVVNRPISPEEAAADIELGTIEIPLNFSKSRLVKPELKDGKSLTFFGINVTRYKELVNDPATGPDRADLLLVSVSDHRIVNVPHPSLYERSIDYPNIPFGRYYAVPGRLSSDSPDYHFAFIDAARTGIDLAGRYGVPIIEIKDDDPKTLWIEFDAIDVADGLKRMMKDTGWKRDNPPWLKPGDHLRDAPKGDGDQDH